MIYEFLKVIFRIAFKLYFREVVINHYQKFPADKPILFVSNHRSSFMDALLIGASLKRQLHFMTRGESFNTPLKRWIFKQFNMHPIYRKEHSPGLTAKNQSLISGFQQLILNNHSVLIFPEGISHVEPKLYPIKTGAARVVLTNQTLASHDFLVVPIGLNYENPHRFRTKVLINFGKAIELEPYFKKYRENEKEAVSMLTDKIRIELEQMALNIEDEDLQDFVPVVRSLYEKELIQKSPITLPKEQKTFQIRKDIIRGMHYIETNFPLRAKRIKKGLLAYKKMLLNHKLKDKWLIGMNQQQGRFGLILKGLLYLFGMPFFLYGLVNHIGIILVPSMIVKSIIKRPDFKGSLMLSFSVLFAFLFYSFQVSLIALMTKSLMWTLVYTVSLPVSCYFMIYYSRNYSEDKNLLKFKLFEQNNQKLLSYLRNFREQILEQLRAARNDFMASGKKD